MRALAFIAALLLACPTAAMAESVDVWGRKVRLTPPAGFCVLGQSDAERALFESRRRAVAPAGLLAQLAVACDELDAVRSGKLDLEGLSRWAQVQFVTHHGLPVSVTVSREAYVRKTAEVAAREAVDIAALNRLGAEHFAPSKTRPLALGAQPIGIVGAAFFASMQLRREADGEAVPFETVYGVTVIQRLPVLVQVYGTRVDVKTLADAAIAYADAVATQNPE